MTAEVSVVIPTRNRREMMPRTLACALSQQDVDVEVVVVDDGSTDDTPNYLSSLADPRVRAVLGGGKGAAAARNRGIAAAEGSWIAFLDDDDLWAPNKLCEQLRAAQQASADVVYSAGLVVDPALGVIADLRPQSTDHLARDLAEYNAVPAGASNLVARRDLVNAAGGFDERLAVLEDWDMWIRLLGEGGDFATAEATHVAYLHHPDAMTSGHAPAVRRALAILEAEHGAWGRRHGADRIGGERFWRWYEESARRAGDRVTAARVLAYRALRFGAPLDLVRAVVMILLGERGMARLSRLRPGDQPQSPPASPPWLDDIRDGSWPPSPR